MNCFECGAIALHKHHVVPRSLGGTKTIDLCEKCHGTIHSHDLNIRAMIRDGVAKARASGIHLGRPRKYILSSEILQMRRNGSSIRQIARYYGGSKSSIERLIAVAN